MDIKYLIMYTGGSSIELHAPLSDGTHEIPGGVWIEVPLSDYIRLMKGTGFAGKHEKVKPDPEVVITPDPATPDVPDKKVEQKTDEDSASKRR